MITEQVHKADNQAEELQKLRERVIMAVLELNEEQQKELLQMILEDRK